MEHVLTSKCQVTIPKAMREFIGVSAGDAVVFEPLADGRLAISPARTAAQSGSNPFAAFRGIAKGLGSTEELMRMTRGDDWNKP
jgi:antitoxin PrlF